MGIWRVILSKGYTRDVSSIYLSIIFSILRSHNNGLAVCTSYWTFWVWGV